jgi:hypothetical protein
MSTVLKRNPRGVLPQVKGDCSDQVHSDQRVIVIAKLEAGPHVRRRKTLKGELESNTRKPWDLVGKLAL